IVSITAPFPDPPAGAAEDVTRWAALGRIPPAHGDSGRSGGARVCPGCYAGANTVATRTPAFGRTPMHMVIEPTDFAKLSAGARAEILKLFDAEPRRLARSAAGATARAGTTADTATNGSTQTAARKGFRWRAPHDLNTRLVKRLMRGIDD